MKSEDIYYHPRCRMCLISTLSSSLTHLCFRKWSPSQALWDLLSSQNRRFLTRVDPVAPGCCPPCEKIRNYNSIITIINSLSTLSHVLSNQVQSSHECEVLFSPWVSWAAQHIPCKYQLTLLCFRMFINSAELSVIGTNLYLELTDWMCSGCREEINILFSGNI